MLKLPSPRPSLSPLVSRRASSALGPSSQALRLKRYPFESRRGEGWDILAEWSMGYRSHIEVRRENGLLEATWTDLMLWAVITGEDSLVRPLWTRSRDPIRAALLSSQLCVRLAGLPHLRSEQEKLRRKALEYEEWALSLLDAVDDSEDALPLLAMVPCVEIGVPLWSNSVIDAAAEDGLRSRSVSCKRFVAHRHSQFLLEAFFAGDYPTSRARVPLDAGLLAILLQCACFFCPGVFCEVLPPSPIVHEERPRPSFTYQVGAAPFPSLQTVRCSLHSPHSTHFA